MELLGLVPFRRSAIVVLAVGLVISLLIWRPLARRFGWRGWATLAALVALSAVLALTIAPGFGVDAVTVRECVPSTRGELLGDLREVGRSRESLLNVLLLLPLGAFAMLATRRILLSAVLVVVLPGVIELAQTQIPGRLCSGSDYIANALGGLVGVAIGAVAAWLISRSARRG